MVEFKSKVLRGATWYVVTQWSLRLLGLVSTAILARVLAPEDFGIVAVVFAVLGVVDALFDFGFEMSLIKDQAATRAVICSAWSLRLLKRFGMGLILVAAAPFMADYSNTPEVVGLSLVVALSISIRGLENIGTVFYHRDLEVNKVFYALVVPKFLGVITSIVLALVLRSFWALVWAQVATSVYFVVVSYLISNYRPKFDLSQVRQVWAFSQWVFVRNMSRQLLFEVDKVILSGLIDKTLLGKYAVGGSVAGIFTSELVAPAGRALTAAMAKVQDDRRQVRWIFLQSSSAVAALVIPIGCGVWLTADEITLIILGKQWVSAAPLLGEIALAFISMSISNMLSGSLTMVGLNKAIALNSAIATALFLGLIYFAFEWYGIHGVIRLKIIVAAIELAGLFILAQRHLKLSVPRMLRDLLRPIVAGGCMVAAVLAVPLPQHLLLGLIVKVGVGALIYAVVSIIIWRLSGKPPGLESTVHSVLAPRLGFLRRA